MNQKTGLVFDIVHGSFVDGYGVRTTIFLKGCPLRCLWCCNPEGQNVYPELMFKPKACTDCGRCIEVCPDGAISTNSNTEGIKLEINRKACTNCGKCIEVCHYDALHMSGKYMSVDELMAKIKKDEQYYRQSGGGVTLGGGEATVQDEFALELIRECKRNYIHTAVDTCGYTTTETGFRVLEEADLILFDLKGIDPEAHIRYTKVTNDIITDNLKKLGDLGKPIIIRIPLIPCYNDSEESIAGMAKFLNKLDSVERVDIIPFHEYGKIKYDELGKEYLLSHISKDMITREKKNRAAQIFMDYGLQVQFGG